MLIEIINIKSLDFVTYFLFKNYSIRFKIQQSPTFTYSGANGPTSWGGICNSGQAQSPIDITPGSAINGSTNPILISQWYDQPSIMTFNNDGSKLTMQLRYASNNVPQLFVVNTTITRYQLIQIQFHSAQVNNTGSEHSISGTFYDIEIQLLFQNVNYNSSTAATQPDGFVIVSKFLTGLTGITVTSSQCDTYSILLQFVLSSGTSYTTLFPWVNSLADICGNIFFSFYEYKGSFTQPGCQEVVTWFISKTPVQVQFPMIRKLRLLLNSAGQPLASNNRPQQPLNGRTIISHEVAYFP